MGEEPACSVAGCKWRMRGSLLSLLAFSLLWKSNSFPVQQHSPPTPPTLPVSQHCYKDFRSMPTEFCSGSIYRVGLSKQSTHQRTCTAAYKPVCALLCDIGLPQPGCAACRAGEFPSLSSLRSFSISLSCRFHHAHDSGNPAAHRSRHADGRSSAREASRWLVPAPA